jgi:predicted nucleic acid-binding protein
MATLVDSSLWIDLTRSRSPEPLKKFVSAQLNDSDICLAEPIVFEVVRNASNSEVSQLLRTFENFPMLATPMDLWSRASRLGRHCRGQGLTIAPLLSLIARS